MALSEKDWIVGIFQAVGALAERLTGEKLVVRLTDSEGNSYDVYADTSDTKWQRPSDAAASPLGDGAPRVDGPLADLSGRDSALPMPSDIPRQRDATGTEASRCLRESGQS